MDPLKFEAWLTEISHWHKPVPSDSAGRKQLQPMSKRMTGPEIQRLKTCQVPCEWCENTCDSTDAKRWYKEATKTGTQWRGYCETCKKKYDPKTQQLGHQAFVKQGLRTPRSPNTRLGRPPKPQKKAWWNDDNGVILNAQDPAERRAELLDRLAALKQNK